MVWIFAADAVDSVRDKCAGGSVGEYRRLVLQGRFNEDDDFSAILKTIAALEEHVEVNSGEAQLQSSSQASLHWLNVVQRPSILSKGADQYKSSIYPATTPSLSCSKSATF